MGGKLGRKFAAVVVALSAVSALAVVAPSASAFDPNANVYWFNYNIDATTHMKKLDQTIVVKGGKFKGGIDFGTGELRGNITLPSATFTYQAAGIVGLLTATARIVPTKAVTGTVDFSTLTVTATSTFRIRIVSAKINGTGNNLVGDYCRTAEPITVTMSGPASLGDASTFSGEFTMPKLIYCGVAQTTALNLVMPGPGNTFSATATPAE